MQKKCQWCTLKILEFHYSQIKILIHSCWQLSNPAPYLETTILNLLSFSIKYLISLHTQKSIKPLKMFAPAHGSSIWTKGWHMATQPTNTQNAKEMDLLAPLALFSMFLLWFKTLQDKDNPFLKPVLSGTGNYQVQGTALYLLSWIARGSNSGSTTDPDYRSLVG